MQNSPLNPYQSPVELVSSSGQLTSAEPSRGLCRIAIASFCFLLGAICLGLGIVWLFGTYAAATRQLGSVGPGFILMLTAYATIVGSAFLTAGFKTINRKDKAAIEFVIIAIIVFGFASVTTGIQ